MRAISSFLVIMSLAVSSVVPAFAQQTLQPGVERDVSEQGVTAVKEEFQPEPTISGTIHKVDRAKNMVDLRTPLGMFRIKVPPTKAQDLKEGETLTVQLAQVERKNPLA